MRFGRLKGVCLVGALSAALVSGLAASADAATERSTIQFGNTAKPGIIKIYGGEGDVTIIGRDGRDVVIETTSSKAAPQPVDDNEKAKGLKRISGSSFTIYTDEAANAIIIERGMEDDVDLTITVPTNTSVIIGGQNRAERIGVVVKTGKDSGDLRDLRDLRDLNDDLKDLSGERREELEKQREAVAEQKKEQEKMSGMVDNQRTVVIQQITGVPSVPGIPGIFSFGGMLDGDVTISNISGSIEIGTIEGDITLKNVSGRVGVNTVDGDVVATITRLTTGESPCMISTVDGDIDVTLPAATRARLVCTHTDGDVYTDFDIALTHEPVNTGVRTGSRNTGSVFGFTNSSLVGTINGGGPMISLRTIDGDIYVRKGK